MGKIDTPTPELVDEFLALNMSGHQKRWIGVTAHEIGHLMGAPEVGNYLEVDWGDCP